MQAPNESSPLPPDAPDFEQRRARSRRLLATLVGVVVLLALATVGYVWLYGRVLRDPDQPPSVLARNPRVLGFEVVLLSVVLLVVGLGLFRMVKRRS